MSALLLIASATKNKQWNQICSIVIIGIMLVGLVFGLPINAVHTHPHIQVFAPLPVVLGAHTPQSNNHGSLLMRRKSLSFRSRLPVGSPLPPPPPYSVLIWFCCHSCHLKFFFVLFTHHPLLLPPLNPLQLIMSLAFSCVVLVNIIMSVVVANQQVELLGCWDGSPG